MKVCHLSSAHQVSDTRIFEKQCQSLSKKYKVYFVVPGTETKTVDNINIVSFPVEKESRIYRILNLSQN